MSKDPCVLETQENCNKKEKTFIEELASWDDEKVKTELASYKSQLEEAKTKHQGFVDLFEKQKDEAMATMKQQEEAKTAMDKLTTSLKYKLSILEQKGGKKDEL